MAESVFGMYQLESKEKLTKNIIAQLSAPVYIQNEIINALDEFFKKIPSWKYNSYTKVERNNSMRTN